MDFDAYAQTAADLANLELTDLADLRAFFGDRPWWSERLTERDLAVFRRAKRKFRDVFVKGAEGDDHAAVDVLNGLLEQFPVQPRIAGHRGGDWHMHVTGRGSSVASEFIAGAAWGLSAWLCRFKGARFGVCADNRCGNVYLDTSSNRCRRFCSERCATRSHVAAHRARKKEAAAAALAAVVDPAVPLRVARSAPRGVVGRAAYHTGTHRSSRALRPRALRSTRPDARDERGPKTVSYAPQPVRTARCRRAKFNDSARSASRTAR